MASDTGNELSKNPPDVPSSGNSSEFHEPAQSVIVKDQPGVNNVQVEPRVQIAPERPRLDEETMEDENTKSSPSTNAQSNISSLGDAQPDVHLPPTLQVDREPGENQSTKAPPSVNFPTENPFSGAFPSKRGLMLTPQASRHAEGKLTEERNTKATPLANSRPDNVSLATTGSYALPPSTPLPSDPPSSLLDSGKVTNPIASENLTRRSPSPGFEPSSSGSKSPFEDWQTDATSTGMIPLKDMSQDTGAPSESAATDTPLVGHGTRFGDAARGNAGAMPTSNIAIKKTLNNRGFQIDPQGFNNDTLHANRAPPAPVTQGQQHNNVEHENNDAGHQNDEGPQLEVPPPVFGAIWTNERPLPVTVTGKPWYCWENWSPIVISIVALGFSIASFVYTLYSYKVSKKALSLQGDSNRVASKQAGLQEWSQYKAFWDYCHSSTNVSSINFKCQLIQNRTLVQPPFDERYFNQYWTPQPIVLQSGITGGQDTAEDFNAISTDSAWNDDPYLQLGMIMVCLIPILSFTLAISWACLTQRLSQQKNVVIWLALWCFATPFMLDREARPARGFFVPPGSSKLDGLYLIGLTNYLSLITRLLLSNMSKIDIRLGLGLTPPAPHWVITVYGFPFIVLFLQIAWSSREPFGRGRPQKMEF